MCVSSAFDAIYTGQGLLGSVLNQDTSDPNRKGSYGKIG